MSPHLPSRPDPRCRHRCTPAEHQGPRSPGIARRSRSPRAEAAHHRRRQLRASNVAAPNAPIAGLPHTRPATRPGPALRTPSPRQQPRAPRCEHDKPLRSPSARRNHGRWRAQACAHGRPPRSSHTASSPRSRCSPGSTGDGAAPRSHYKPDAGGCQLANARPAAFPLFLPWSCGRSGRMADLDGMRGPSPRPGKRRHVTRAAIGNACAAVLAFLVRDGPLSSPALVSGAGIPVHGRAWRTWPGTPDPRDQGGTRPRCWRAWRGPRSVIREFAELGDPAPCLGHPPFGPMLEPTGPAERPQPA